MPPRLPRAAALAALLTTLGACGSATVSADSELASFRMTPAPTTALPAPSPLSTVRTATGPAPTAPTTVAAPGPVTAEPVSQPPAGIPGGPASVAPAPPTGQAAAPAASPPAAHVRSGVAPSPARSAAAPAPAPRPAPAPPAPAPPPTGTAAAYESRMLALINARRAAAGARPLLAQPCADGFAGPWSPAMASRGGLSHQDLRAVLSRCNAGRAGENVGLDSRQDPQAMFDAFMASPPHAANILNPAFTAIGIGAFRDGSGTWWVTQDFVG